MDFTLFNYSGVSPDWKYRNRTLNDHLVYFVTNRSFKATINHYIPLNPGEGSLLWIPPHIPHTFSLNRRGDPLKLYHFRFTPTVPFPSSTPCFFLRSAWHLREKIDQLYREYRQEQLFSRERIKALMFLILSDLWRERDSPGRPYPGREGLTPEQQERIHRFARDSAAVRFSPEEMARAAGLEPGYFARRFGKTFAMSPRSWIIRERIRRIQAEMGESTLTLTELSEKYGYPDLFSFSKQFKRVAGKSPRDYRKEL